MIKRNAAHDHIAEHHEHDDAGNPTGGSSHARGISVYWQNGSTKEGREEVPPEGAYVEDVVKIALGRLKFYQASKFANPHTARAIEHLEAALLELSARTEDRLARGTHGRYKS